MTETNTVVFINRLLFGKYNHNNHNIKILNLIKIITFMILGMMCTFKMPYLYLEELFKL